MALSIDDKQHHLSTQHQVFYAECPVFSVIPLIPIVIMLKGVAPS
jgi:hypothetical protein